MGCDLHRERRARRRRGRATPLALGALLGSALLAAALVLVLIRGDSTDGPPVAPAAPAPSPPAARPAAGPAAEQSAPRPVDPPHLAPLPARETVIGEPAGTLERAPAAGTPSLTLVGRWMRPDRRPIEVEDAEWILVAPDGGTLRAAAQAGSAPRLEGVPVDRYRVRVEAPGHRHREQVLDLAPQAREAARQQAEQGSELEHELDLVLWPEGWVAVRLETRDGRPFGELAQELGLEPHQLFTAVFDVRARRAAPPAGELDVPGEEGLAKFHRAPGHRVWRLPEGSLGSLELHAHPPLWLGLWMHGTPLAWEPLHAADDQVLFRMELEDLQARLATLRLRVVAAETGAPATDARVTLRANSSAHRRSEQIDRRVGPDGRLELTRIVPGSYELAVTRGESILPEAVELLPSQVLDLGDIALPLGEAFEVEVAHADGRLSDAFLEIGPYRPGELADGLYPSHLQRQYSPARAYPLPVPVVPSIVRATGITLIPGGRFLQTDGRSANVLLDPRDLPPAPLRLVLHAQHSVSFTLPEDHGFGGARVDVLDELELVVGRSRLTGARSGDVDLIPGAYRARLVGAAGEVLDEMRFELGNEALEVRWP